MNEIEGYLEYYTLLKQIELIYKEKFRDIDDPKQEYYDKMKYLIAHSMPVVGHLNEEISFEILSDKKATIEKLKAVYEKGENFEVDFNNKEVYELHHRNIVLGYRTIEFHSPYTLNIERLISGEDEIVKIKALEKVKITYRQ